MKTQTRLLCCLLLFAAAIGRTGAQNKINIIFNEKGQIIDSLPPLVTASDSIRFFVITSRDSLKKRELAAYMLYVQIIKNLDEKDKKNTAYYKVLKDIGEEDNRDMETMIRNVQSTLARRLLTYLDAEPENEILIAKAGRTPADDRYIFQKYIDNNAVHEADWPKLYIPELSDFIYPNYELRYGFSEGINLASAYYPSPQAILLQRIETRCCLVRWQSSCNRAENYQGYPFNGAFTNYFKLVMKNNNLAAYNKQAPRLSWTTINNFHYDVFKKNVNHAIDLMLNQPANVDYQHMYNWLVKKYQGNDDPMLKKLALAAGAPVIGDFKGKLDKIYQDQPELTIMSSNDMQLFLFSLVWLSQGKSLNTNPLSIGVAPDNKQALQDISDSLTIVNQQEVAVADKVGMLKSAAGAGATTCCSTPYVSKLAKQYDVLSKTKANLDKTLAELNKRKDALTKQQVDYPKNLAAFDQNYLQDSLLYKGMLLINPKQDSSAYPNLPGYQYMRNHNALQDYHHFDIRRQLAINELQHMNIFVVNSDRRTMFSSPTTYAALSASDYFSNVIVASAQAVAPAAINRNAVRAVAAAKALDDLYADYAKKNNLFAAFKNGVIAQHIFEKEDTSADFITRNVPHAGPDVAGKVVTYGTYDLTGKKNLNSEGVTFSYNDDKLQRFSFKAGIAYSWLSRRTYTINPAANTATYTDSYAGLAPVIGFQVFTQKVDMQSERFLPVSYYPFFYVGYMFHDTPANNFLFGAGWELISGMSFIMGAHLGKTQGLTLEQGNLLEKDRYKLAPFISISVGIQAFKTIFSASTLTDPLK